MSQQLGALDRRLTPGEQRRRLARLARRRERGIVSVMPAPRERVRRTWQGFAALRARVKAAKDAAGDFVAALTASKVAPSPRVTCPFVRVRMTSTGDVIPADRKRVLELPACSGRMRRQPTPKDDGRPRYRCDTCGRAWLKTGEPTRGLRGWVELF